MPHCHSKGGRSTSKHLAPWMSLHVRIISLLPTWSSPRLTRCIRSLQACLAGTTLAHLFDQCGGPYARSPPRVLEGKGRESQCCILHRRFEGVWVSVFTAIRPIHDLIGSRRLGQFWRMKSLVRDSFQVSQDYYPETFVSWFSSLRFRGSEV